MHYAFFWDELAGVSHPADPADRNALVGEIEKRWKLDVLGRVPERLITSDNPVKLFGVRGDLMFALLPVTPSHALVAFNSEHISLASTSASSDDVKCLNSLQVRTCIRQVYADHDLSPNLPMINSLLGKPGPHFGRIGNESFIGQYHQYTADEFSFIVR
jgi:hypothetical protein